MLREIAVLTDTRAAREPVVQQVRQDVESEEPQDLKVNAV